MTIHHGAYVQPHPDRTASPDVLLGAYLMTHFRQTCENCGTFETPQWRKGWYSEMLGRSVLLCNACGLKYHKNQFCPYCRYVYGKEQDRVRDGWLTCGHCGRWVHGECEQLFGDNKNGISTHYTCPGCRNINVSQTYNTLLKTEYNTEQLQNTIAIKKEEDVDMDSTPAGVPVPAGLPALISPQPLHIAPFYAFASQTD